MRSVLTILIILMTFFPIREIWSNSKYELSINPVLLKLSRDSLHAQIGIQEPYGRNGGETLKYQKPFGLSYQSYCAMGQDWCYWVNDSGMLPWFSPNAQAHFNYARKHGTKVPYEPSRDDFLVWMKVRTVFGHIERIDSVLQAGWVITVGFNTSNGKTGSQREGNGVFQRRRNIYHPIGRLIIKGLVGFKHMDYEKNKQGCCYE